MGTGERIALAITTVALVTTLVLPGRQTARVLEVTFGGFANALRTAMGR